MLNETSTFVLEDIAPGAARSIVVRVKALKEISSTNQSISTELKYSYDSGGMLTQATASDRVNFSALVPSCLLYTSPGERRSPAWAPVRRLWPL